MLVACRDAFEVQWPRQERDPYKRSTVPIWAEKEEEVTRPSEEPLIPFKVQQCYLELCNNSTNFTDCNLSNSSNDTNSTVLGVCGLTAQSGAYASVQEMELYQRPYHWLQVTSPNGSEHVLELSVAPANSPALLQGRSQVLLVETGGDSLLQAEDGGPFLELQALSAAVLDSDRHRKGLEEQSYGR